MSDLPFVKGSNTDYALIHNLLRQEKWSAGLDLINELLPLNDDERAPDLLQNIVSHDPRASIARELMHLRGLCLLRLFPLEVARLTEESDKPLVGVVISHDPRIVMLSNMIQSHAIICAKVYGDDSDVLLFAAAASSISGDREMGVILARRVCELDPANTKASAIIELYKDASNNSVM